MSEKIDIARIEADLSGDLYAEPKRKRRLLSSDRLYWRPMQIAREFSLGKTAVYEMISIGAFGVPIRLSDKPGSGLLIHRDGLIRFIKERQAAMAEEMFPFI